MVQPTMWWFGPASARTLARRLVVALLTRQFVRLEVHPYEKDGTTALMLYVVTKGFASTARRASAGDPQGINESFPCPPVCPGGGG